MELLPQERKISGKALSVFELTLRIKEILENDEILSGVWVEGEVSNLVKAASGHAYFTLKDSRSVIKAALWAGNRRRIKVDFKNGDRLLAFGNISVYEPRGEYQLIVSDLKPAGLGALYEAFEQLKRKLEEEGLFDPSHKLALPFLPRGVGIVTSPKGAVVQDIFRVIRRRFPNMPIYLVPVKVQGEGASEEVMAGIRKLDMDPRIDVVIIARGGGSIEDLWTFNEEGVARVIAAAIKPIVSAIGHETDTTIADFVADKRAATPSVAGELVVPVKDELLKAIGDLNYRLKRALQNQLAIVRQRFLKTISCRFLRKPALFVSERRLRISNLVQDFENNFRRFITKLRNEYQLLSAKLESLNPKALTNRGFIMAYDENEKVVTSIKGLKTNDRLFLHFNDGRAVAGVEKIESTVEGS